MQKTPNPRVCAGLGLHSSSLVSSAEAPRFQASELMVPSREVFPLAAVAAAASAAAAAAVAATAAGCLDPSFPSLGLPKSFSCHSTFPEPLKLCSYLFWDPG